jgi:hypothetical protein
MTNPGASWLLVAFSLTFACGGGDSDALGPEDLSFTVEERLRTSDDRLGAAANESVVGIGVGGVLAGGLCGYTVHPTGRVSGTSVSLTVELRPRSGVPCPPAEYVIVYGALFRDLTPGETYTVRVVHIRQPGNEVTVPFEGPVSVCCAQERPPPCAPGTLSSF